MAITLMILAICCEFVCAQSAESLDAKLFNLRRLGMGFETNTAVVSQKYLSLLDEYSKPKEEGKIYAALADMYRQAGLTDADSAIRYAKMALEYPLDVSTAMNVYSIYGSALEIKNRGVTGSELADVRKEIAEVYLNGIHEGLLEGVPPEELPVPHLGFRTVLNGMPDPEVERMRQEQRAADEERANSIRKMNDLVDLRHILEGQIVFLYTRRPLNTDELEDLARDVLQDEDATSVLVEKVKEGIQKRFSGDKDSAAVAVAKVAVGAVDGFEDPNDSPRLRRVMKLPLISTGSIGPLIRTENIAEAGSKDTWNVVAFTPDRILKSATNLPTQIEVRYSLPDGAGAGATEYPSLPAKGRVLLFLEEPVGTDTAYVLPRDSCSVVLLSNTPVKVLGEGVEDLNAVIEDELAAALQSGDKTIQESALYAVMMFGVSGDAIMKSLRVLSESKDPSLRIRSVAERVRFGETAMLPELLTYIEEAYSSEPVNDLLLFDGIHAIQAINTVDCLGDLVKFVKSPATPDSYRRVAVHTIAYNINDDRVVPVLVSLLEDSDSEIQWEAMNGLYRLEKPDESFELPGTEYAPGLELLNSNPNKYLGNWRNWWATAGRSKYAQVLDGN